MSANRRQPADDLKLLFVIARVHHSRIISRCKGDMGKDNVVAKYALDSYKEPMGISEGSPDKPGGLSIQLCKSEKKEFYIRYSS